MTSAELKLLVMNSVDRMPVVHPEQQIHKTALREQIESAFEAYENEESAGRIASGAIVENTDSRGNFRKEQFIPKPQVVEPDEPVIQIEKPIPSESELDAAIRRREISDRLNHSEVDVFGE